MLDTYQMMFAHSNINASVVWRRIWNLEIAEIIKCFIWQTYQERLLTNLEGVVRQWKRFTCVVKLSIILELSE